MWSYTHQVDTESLTDRLAEDSCTDIRAMPGNTYY